jgi:hypothetical protein
MNIFTAAKNFMATSSHGRRSESMLKGTSVSVHADKGGGVHTEKD